MVSNKSVGLAMLVLASVGPILYVVGVSYFGTILIEFTVVAALLAVSILFGWIGYSLLTEPPTPAPAEIDLDSLEPETINPPREDSTRIQSNFSVIRDSEIGEGTEIRDQVNLYKCKIGKDCKIESFVYIEEGVVIGDRCKIKPNVYIPSGVKIEDDVFIGPNTTFTNDKHPRASGDWKLVETVVCKGASIGANAVILPGVRIGKGATIGAGAVVTRDVGDGEVATGNPARAMGKAAPKVDIATK
jgi:UDP-2-acetamido-3-amino-2,3-dideoxy-glucuronate N-acetyltransferase